MSRPSKKLADEWYAKLYVTGFRDLEHTTNKDYPIHSEVFSLHSINRIPVQHLELFQAYINSGKIKKQRDVELLKLHMAGQTTRYIQQKLSEFFPAISQQRVSKIIINLRKKALKV